MTKEMRNYIGCTVLAYCLSGFPVFAQAPLSGGDTTVFVETTNAFSMPAKNLSITRRENFFIGNAFFKNPWVTAPSSTTARDGLGPLFNTNACQSCHIKDGRGRPPTENEVMTSMLVRIGLDSNSAGDSESLLMKGVIGDPNYGVQIQNRAIAGLKPEAQVNLEWVEQEITFSNNETFSLRYPSIQLSHLQYGSLHHDVVFSAVLCPRCTPCYFQCAFMRRPYLPCAG